MPEQIPKAMGRKYIKRNSVREQKLFDQYFDIIVSLLNEPDPEPSGLPGEDTITAQSVNHTPAPASQPSSDNMSRIAMTDLTDAQNIVLGPLESADPMNTVAEIIAPQLDPAPEATPKTTRKP